MTKLYELADQYRELADMLEENEDMDQQMMLDTLEGSTEMMSIGEKAEGIIYMMKNWEAEVPGYDAEIKRLIARKKAVENRAKSVKTYLHACMERAGLKEIKVGTFKAKIQRNSRGAVLITSAKDVPASYLDIVPEHTEVNNDRLYQDLKTGKEIPGVKYEVGTHLRIS